MVKVVSSDGKTTKYRYPANNGFVEVTYVNYHNKHIICFSSMIGCPIGCSFCVSGQRRDVGLLTTHNMIHQCRYVIEQENLTDTKPILFSCMGEGEPFLNYNRVVWALKELGNEFPNSKLALSTSGIKPHLIEALADETFPTPLKLQVSIHSTNDSIRNQLIPISQPLTRIREAIRVFHKSQHSIELNYVLINGVNDSTNDAKRLAEYAEDIPIKLNMLNSNLLSRLRFTNRLDQFVAELNQEGVVCEFYETNGTDINAACGQLTYQQNT